MPKTKARSAELREEMKRASQEIAKDPTHMRAAERKGFAPPGQKRRAPGRKGTRARQEKGKDLGKDRDFDMER